MVRFMGKISKKVGLPPGSLVHIGEIKAERVRIQIIDYDEEDIAEQDLRSVEECLPYLTRPTTTWINIDGIHDVELIRKTGEIFDLHPLILEDILNTEQRPKLDDFEDYLYISLKMLSYDTETNRLITENLSLVLGSNFIISFQESEGDVFNPVRERIRKGKGRIRKAGHDYLLYALLDAVVDNYFIVLEKIGEEIESLEEGLITNATPKHSQRIHNLKRELIFLRKSVWPLREVIGNLNKGESALIQDKTAVFLRDVYDHTIQVVDIIETFRDMASGMLDVFLSSVSNRMNEVMKVLTIIGTIFIPLTFFAGIYGMNFKYMPELEWPWGYPSLWMVFIFIAAVMVTFFKRKRWL
ncbi:MAG: magnesium/cobalt transporter CorA [Desulfatiglandales bacterium]